MYGHSVVYILSDKQNTQNMVDIAEENGLEYVLGSHHLFEMEADIVFFANPFERAKELRATTVFLEHGIGTKSTSFYKGLEYFDLYLTEGDQKHNLLQNLYPQYANKLLKVGFSKLDLIVNFTEDEKRAIVEKYGLDTQKKTILYAPTFFPSSIEVMSDNFPEDFSECNILIKPHYLTYERKKYKKQIAKLQRWSHHPNCTVLPLSDYNIIPFLAIADVMLSDESSAMFEFASLNKPVVSNRYFKLRWSYYFMPWKLKSRIDPSKESYRVIFDNAYSYKETYQYLKEALLHPAKLEAKRISFSKEICGEIDGKVSERIYTLCINYHAENNGIRNV